MLIMESFSRQKTSHGIQFFFMQVNQPHISCILRKYSVLFWHSLRAGSPQIATQVKFHPPLPAGDAGFSSPFYIFDFMFSWAHNIMVSEGFSIGVKVS